MANIFLAYVDKCGGLIVSCFNYMIDRLLLAYIGKLNTFTTIQEGLYYLKFSTGSVELKRNAGRLMYQCIQN